MLKNLWKHSRLRFYIMNTLWNYKFWLFAKKIYQETYFSVNTNEYEMDITFNLHPKTKKIKRKRFIGYMYKNAIYVDNPGIQGVDIQTWISWRKKGLLK